MRVPISLLAAGMLFAASCNNETTTHSENNSTTDSAVSDASAIRLGDVPASPDFPDAQLSMTGMTAAPTGADSVKVSFTFGVKNYELKAQTHSETGGLCNNSAQGQHIHFILDNRPYVALYEPKHETTVAKNSEHYLLCFLSRSYHESVKSRPASVLVHFRVDEQGKIRKLDSPSAPMLFYSRPKGDYLAKDTANVLLDFYPVNTDLNNDYKVKADIRNETNGRTASFTLGEWKPYFMQNLGTGKTTIVLSLLDKDGNTVTGEHTSITRTINLAAGEPMAP